MAIDCTAESLGVNASSLFGSLSTKQLLAALVYIQCTSNGMTCNAQALSDASKCLWGCLNDRQLLAALVYIQCTGGGSGPTATCVTGGNSPPVGTPPCDFSVWIQGPGPNFGVWLGDTGGWSSVAAIAQGP